MATNGSDFTRHIKQPNVLAIAGLMVLLLLISLLFPQILESSYLAAKFKPFIEAAGRICMFILYAMSIVLVVNWVFYGVLRMNRHNFYTDDQRADLIAVLRQPEARADIEVFRQKTKSLTLEKNILTEIVASMIPSALRQQFMLEQYFKTKIENYMNRFTGSINTITTLSGLGPIIGFLGTLLGLILAFAVSADAIRTEGQMSPDTFGQLQYSIMIAIMTSVYGVVIKVVGSLIRQGLLSKIDKVTDEIGLIPIEAMYEED